MHTPISGRPAALDATVPTRCNDYADHVQHRPASEAVVEQRSQHVGPMQTASTAQPGQNAVTTWTTYRLGPGPHLNAAGRPVSYPLMTEVGKHADGKPYVYNEKKGYYEYSGTVIPHASLKHDDLLPPPWPACEDPP